MYSLENTVIDDVLCYITSSRNSITNDSIIVNAAGFYKPEIVRKSKELIFQICNERAIARKVLPTDLLLLFQTSKIYWI